MERRKESNRRKQVRKKRREPGRKGKERKRWMGRSKGSEKSSKNRIEWNRIK